MSFVLTTELERAGKRTLPAPAADALTTALEHIRKGCFQRSLCLVVAATSVASGLEVGYEHYKGSYSNPVMYTPVVLSGILAGTALAGIFSRWGARVALRTTSMITLADGIIGFYFHVRGIARKPGGWSLPITNIVMGPPIFAPLLFGTSAYLGLMASYLRREEEMNSPAERAREALDEVTPGKSDWREDLRYGRFQKHLAVVTLFWAFFSGFEAWYSHYKSNFRYKVQWSPVILTPLLMASGIGAIKSHRLANTALPASSALAMANGAIGFYYHARGIVKRPGGTKKPIYNILYGPPVFAPLLFAACGFLGMMASLLRRER
jgi:hypothetical protein